MKTLISGVTIVNEGRQFKGDILINNDVIERISELPERIEANGAQLIDGNGKIAIPGVIDDQVHFREPGLTHKGEIATESAAAVAGGVTTYMEMPNTSPQTITNEALEKKFELAAQKSVANFSFYLGATNDNLKELVKVDPKSTCGVKVFMGASTGNMLVDDDKALQGIFAEVPILIATHCEDENTIRTNLDNYTNKYGDAGILPKHHPEIRSEEACYISSAKAVELATKYNSQLHVLHLSTARELGHFTSGKIEDKKITAEICVHHLWFNSNDYDTLGHRIKWNPAVKTPSDQAGLFEGLLKDKLDVIATDHAPHTLDEKLNAYKKSASGGPLVQHSLTAMLSFYKQGKISLESVVEKMCHNPAKLFSIEKRGYIREGYFADIALVDLNNPFTVSKENILYKCKWSPFEGVTFPSTVTHTFVNGHLAFENGQIDNSKKGRALSFNR